MAFNIKKLFYLIYLDEKKYSGGGLLHLLSTPKCNYYTSITVTQGKEMSLIQETSDLDVLDSMIQS